MAKNETEKTNLAAVVLVVLVGGVDVTPVTHGNHGGGEGRLLVDPADGVDNGVGGAVGKGNLGGAAEEVREVM